MDQNACSREAVVPQILGKVEKQLDRLGDITQKLVERLEPVTRASTDAKTPQSERPASGVVMAERIARIDEGLEKNGDRLRSLLDRLEI